MIEKQHGESKFIRNMIRLMDGMCGEIEMIELKQKLQKEVNKTLDGLYNYKKEVKGLVSAHNTLIIELKKVIDIWVKEK